MDLNEVIEKILNADKAYYNTGYSLMTDQEYDSLKDYIKRHDPEHPILMKVGEVSRDSVWDKASHEIAMGSLEKINSKDEFIKWVEKFPEELLIFEPKLDGLSLSLSYMDNKFIQGVTRGDGEIGEDISENVKKMRGFIPEFNGVFVDNFKGSVRCEVTLPYADFIKINSILPEKERYENVRNAASGISRRLDGKYCKYLQLIYYDVVTDNSLDEIEKIKLLKDLLLEVVFYSSGNREIIIESFDKLKDLREKLPYQIDGAVIKINSHKKQKELGWLNGRPKGQIAWKFDPPGAITTLLDVTWEVGRTGVITPLGYVEPVKIDGSTIRKVTLHNIAEIERLAIGIGDTVMLIKANDVIPKIQKVMESKNVKIKIPTVCPSCGSVLENNGIQLFCKSDLCPARNVSRIMNWIKVTGIENMGEATVNVLIETGVLNNIRDIYRLPSSGIAMLPGYGEKSANKIISNINSSLNMNLPTFLSALGIPGLSTKTAADLVDNFKTLENILALKTSDIIKIKGYSDISSTQIVGGLSKYKEEILDLITIINFSSKSEGVLLSGKSFCFTGAMEKPRPYYQGLVTKNGGKNDSSVLKTTTFLVCNENKGSSKSTKAEKLGVKIISSMEFMSMLGDVPEEPVIEKVKTYSLFEE